MELGRQRVFWFTDLLKPAQLIELVQRSEQLGYGTLWYPEAVGYECFGLGSFLLANTYRPEGCSDSVRVHDFVDPNLGNAVRGACPWA